MDTIKFTFIGFLIVNFGGYIGCHNPGVVRLIPNVAPRGIASQSTGLHVNTRYAASPFLPSYANDGNIESTMTETSGACSKIPGISPVWWQVDLLKVYQITKVAVTRWDRSVDLGHFYIDVSNNSDGSAAQQCAREPNKFDTGTTRVYPCPCGMFGRYVRIRYDVGDTNHLLMCEVQVQPRGLCPEPEEMDNAVKSVPPQYEVGNNITYTCHRCYAGGGTSTCQCNRMWSPVEKCTIEYCSDPGPIENGQIEGIGPFNCISTVKYTCNEGYWLLGAETLRCGIDGLWSHAIPSCIDKKQECGKPPKIPNSQRFGSVTDITYQCEECYLGEGSATCRGGKWTHDGSCVVLQCDDVPDEPNGKRSPAEGSVTCGTKVTYTCNEGLPVEGDSVLECGIEGKLEGRVPVCRGPGNVRPDDEKDNGKNTDVLVLGLTAVFSMVGGILITVVVGFWCKRKGIGPFKVTLPNQGPNHTNQDYDQPNPPPENAQSNDPVTAYVNDNSNDQYAELEDPQFAGYINPVSN